MGTSAIEQMMGLLAPPQQPPPGGLLGGPMPAVLSSQMPQMPAPPMASPKRSMVDRIQERIQGLLGSVQPSAPGGYGGLLSPDEMEQAKPGKVASLYGRIMGLGSDVFTKDLYKGNLNSVLGMKQLAAKMAEQQKAAELEKKREAGRQAVGSILGDTSMTPDARFAALTKLLGAAYTNGDMESMGAISSAMQSAGTQTRPASTSTTAPRTLNTDEGIMQWNPATKKFEPTGMDAPPRASGGVDRVIVPVQQPDGTVTYMSREDAVGHGAPGTRGSKATEGETAYGMFAARMSSASKLLDEYESKGMPGSLQTNLRKVPIVGEEAANRSSSENQQLYRQAQEDWVRAKLRKESGAVIGKEEMEQEITTYFPQPGDHPSVVAQKKARRQEAETLMRQAAGRGAAAFNPKGSGSESGVPDYETWKKSKVKP